MGDTISTPGSRHPSPTEDIRDVAVKFNQDGSEVHDEKVVAPEVIMATPKPNLEVTNEEPTDEAPDIEIPPPMPVQDPSHMLVLGSQVSNQEDLAAKFASTLSLKTRAESSLDLANEIENLVKQRTDPQSDQTGSDSGAETGGEESTQDKKEAERLKYLTKRRYVMQELIETERDYVKDLGTVVEGYMKYMSENPMPDDMNGKDKIVFGNIHQIYDWHKETFQAELEKCEEDAERLGLTFTRYERRLYMYVKYCENKPKSEFVVAEYVDTYFEEIRQKLGHKLHLADLLIKPVQRIMKYQLLLKDILKYTEKAGLDATALRKACEVMCVVPKAANDMMQVGRLQGFDGKITAQGKLLLQDTLLVAEISSKLTQPKFKERRVFLFEQIIIFSEMIEKKKGSMSNANYIFKNSIKVNKMSMSEKVEDNDPLKFLLTDLTPGSDIKFIIQAPAEDVKHTWTQEIQKILEMQGDFLRALQSPIAFMKELTKELSAPELGNTSKEGQLRKTQSQPQPGRGDNPMTAKNLLKCRTRESPKHSRCKSVPDPLKEVVHTSGNKDQQKMSCPSSPIETPKEFGHTTDNNLEGLNTARSSSNPSLSDIDASASDGSETSKPKKTIFEGFRNTLRKSKNENSSSAKVDASSFDNSADNECQRTKVGNTASGSAGKQLNMDNLDGSDQNVLRTDGNLTHGKILYDYTAVKEDEVSVIKGETVQILATNQYNMFLIHRPANMTSPAAEGWIPSYVIGPKDGEGSLKRSTWQMFKLKKPVFKSEKSVGCVSPISMDRKSRTLPRAKEGTSKLHSPDFMYEMSPSVHTPLTSITVQAGDTATLMCRVCGRPRPSIMWKFKDSIVIVPNGRTLMSYGEDGVATLQISQVTVSDSGEYSCVATSEIGGVFTRATMTVMDRPGPPTKPQIMNQVGTAVHLEWSPPPTSHYGGQIQGYTIEYKEAGCDHWLSAIPYVPNTSQVLGDLMPGVTYQFRVFANNTIGRSHPSLSSDYVCIPTESELSEREDASYAIWKTTFDNDFSEMEELGRGRFAVVKRCIQKCSGQVLAAKLISSSLQSKEAVETEFNTLQSLQHINLVRVFDLYETSNSLIIIMQLMHAGRLFDFICSKSQFDELECAEFIQQLLDVVQYLHNCRIAHLDIKPENLLVEVGTGSTNLKLIDFGDARHIYNNYYIHQLPGNPEFLAPEIVGGTPVGLLTDIWSVGVILYVMLSGVSPFLDESEEETCSNILRNDYCFPEEFFAGISPEAKDLISSILVEDLSKRPTVQVCMESSWMKKAIVNKSSQLHQKPIPTARLADFIKRRSHQVLRSED
ncbi:hypothetical protein ACJMK2_014258 [Sinanodonta woodiana]|uniref:Non-specific serine/threonine protein kinase n=1 Tax=Sinanodonta woodiana TaxID=1069815 RepID=A0ABD3V360_SINWO